MRFSKNLLRFLISVRQANFLKRLHLSFVRSTFIALEEINMAEDFSVSGDLDGKTRFSAE